MAEFILAPIWGAKGRTDFAGRVCIGYAGVAKAGEEEKSWSFPTPGVALNRGGGGLGVEPGFSILVTFTAECADVENRISSCLQRHFSGEIEVVDSD